MISDEELTKHYKDAGLDPEPYMAERKYIREFQKRYYEQHKLCPKCKSKNYWSTLVGYIPTSGHLESFKNKNEIYCNCGWIGITHDLIGEDDYRKEKKG